MLQYNIVGKKRPKKCLKVEQSSRVTKFFFFSYFPIHLLPLPFFSCRKGTEQGLVALKLLNAVLWLLEHKPDQHQRSAEKSLIEMTK